MAIVKKHLTWLQTIMAAMTFLQLFKCNCLLHPLDYKSTEINSEIWHIAERAVGAFGKPFIGDDALIVILSYSCSAITMSIIGMV